LEDSLKTSQPKYIEIKHKAFTLLIYFLDIQFKRRKTARIEGFKEIH